MMKMQPVMMLPPALLPRPRRSVWPLLLVVALLVTGAAISAEALASSDVKASVSTGQILNASLNMFQGEMKNWQESGASVAKALLYTLLTISLTYKMGMLLMHGHLNLGMIFMELIRFIMTGGFLILLIEQGPALMLQLSSYLSQHAGLVADPSGIVSIGTAGFGRITDTMEKSSWFGKAITMDNAVKFALAIFLLAVHAIVAIKIMLAYISLYFVIYAGVLFLGFAATDWTRDIMHSWLKSAAAQVINIYALVLVVSLGAGLVGTAINAFCEDHGQSAPITTGTTLDYSAPVISSSYSRSSENIASKNDAATMSSASEAVSGTAVDGVSVAEAQSTNIGALATLFVAALIFALTVDTLPAALASAITGSSGFGSGQGITAMAAGGAAMAGAAAGGAASMVLTAGSKGVQGAVSGAARGGLAGAVGGALMGAGGSLAASAAGMVGQGINRAMGGSLSRGYSSAQRSTAQASNAMNFFGRGRNLQPGIMKER